jgi:hypothetical protein
MPQEMVSCHGNLCVVFHTHRRIVETVRRHARSSRADASQSIKDDICVTSRVGLGANIAHSHVDHRRSLLVAWCARAGTTMWWVVDESRAAAVSDVANRQVEEPNPVHDTTFLRVRLELHDMRERETTWIIFGEFYSHTVRLRRACLVR